MKIKIGIVGCGRFSTQFIPLFRDHPMVEKVVLCDTIPERADNFAKMYHIKDVFYSYDELLKSDINCVGIFTQRHLHAPMVLKALEAGKHVCEAVPMANSIEDINAIIEKVKQTGLIFMTLETSYYYASTIFCRKKFKEGLMGDFVYGEARYCHNMLHFYDSFKYSGGNDWKKLAGFPPMYYPTHSISMILSVTNAVINKVSCSGFVDTHEDGIFTSSNQWGNKFSNQTALMYTSDGGSCVINEFRRTGYTTQKNGVYMSMFGTKGVYEQGASGCSWMEMEQDIYEDVTQFLNCSSLDGYDLNITEEHIKGSIKKDFVTYESSVHNKGRLPEVFKGHKNGHFGSHQFLVDDFIKAVVADKLPPNHAWASAAYCAPGLVAHDSAVKDGMLINVPDFGNPPPDKVMLDPDFGWIWG